LVIRTPLIALLAFFAAILAVRPARAQIDEGNQAAGILQLFADGNGVRGVITAAGSCDFVIRTDEGESYKIFYSSNTHLMKDRQPIDAGDIHIGDMLIAAGQLDNKAKTLGAVFLFDVDAAEVRKARAGFGETWTAGKVTSIQGLRISIARADDAKKKQIVAVDENTSFRKRNEDVTLGDIKVGDFISAQGALKGDFFLATLLRVMQPGPGAVGFPATP
jgi:hypothetical protein